MSLLTAIVNDKGDYHSQISVWDTQRGPGWTLGQQAEMLRPSDQIQSLSIRGVTLTDIATILEVDAAKYKAVKFGDSQRCTIAPRDHNTMPPMP